MNKAEEFLKKYNLDNEIMYSRSDEETHKLSDLLLGFLKEQNQGQTLPIDSVSESGFYCKDAASTSGICICSKQCAYCKNDE